MNKILIYSLSATNGTHLSKTQTQSYPNVKHFKSTEHRISTPKQLNTLIKKTAAAGDCLIKGILTRPLNDESRARSTDSSLQTQWICFDLDGAQYTSPEEFVQQLPVAFRNISYTTQYSASQNLKPGLRCHLFFLLRSPVFPVALKAWFKLLNFSTPTLQSAIHLSATNVGLLWPLDITVGQNDKIIYVAPPTDREDKNCPNPWIEYTQKPGASVDFNKITFDPNEAKIQEKKTINTLRSNNGLTVRRNFNFKKVGSVEVMSNPGECIVTGVKEERDFIYLNLNGGDSWGYYHPIGQNQILYNFKGEPPYLIKELIPDYYNQLTDQQITTSSADVSSVRYLAFCDARTDTYYRGIYDEVENYVDLYKTSALTKVSHFLKQHGQPVPDFIPEWDLIYDFQSDILLSEDERWINQYQKSEYMKAYQPRAKIPVLIELLIMHVVNYDKTVYAHFLNWLSYIIQFRRQTGTAWVLHGTQGTGKGILFNKLLLPILGENFVFRTQLETFEKEFNGFMEHSLLVLVDESQISDLQKSSRAMSSIKQYITDPVVGIRRMRTDPYIVENVTSFIFNSNKHDPIQVDASDRRFNVAPRQETPLLTGALTHAQIDELCNDDNIQGFCDFLMSYKVNKKAAATVINTSERSRLMSLTQDAAEELVQCLLAGKLEFFVDNAPDSEDTEILKLKLRIKECRTYEDIINEFITISKTGAITNISRTDLEVLCYYIIGTEYPTRHKFTKYIGHKGLTISTVNIDGKTTRGVREVRFVKDDKAAKRWTNRSGSKTAKKVVRLASKARVNRK